MAKHISIGQPVNEYERNAIAFLKKRLPETFTLITNFELKQGTEIFEVDLAIIAPQCVFVVDIKNMAGHIDIDEKWHPENRASFPSPLAKLRSHARIISSTIGDFNRIQSHTLAKIHIQSAVLFTSLLLTIKDLEPLIYGGGHQKGMRSGTLNVPGIAGLGEACRLRQLEMVEDETAIAIKRDRLQTLLQESIPDLVINGDRTNRLAGNLHISIPSIPNKAIIARIRDRLAISTGSACSSGIENPSHVLQAIALPEHLIEGALRISIGKFTTDKECDRASTILTEAVHQVRQILA